MDHGKTPWTSSKKRKQRRTNEIHLWVKKRKLASHQAGKKIDSREEKGSVKIWELDSDNSDFYSDFSVDSDTDESSDSLRSIGILSMHICSASLSFVCSLRPATIVFVSFFVFPILPDQLQEKPSYRKIISPPWAHCETQGCFGDSRINFTARKNFPNAAQWSENPVEGVCGRSLFAK